MRRIYILYYIVIKKENNNNNAATRNALNKANKNVRVLFCVSVLCLWCLLRWRSDAKQRIW